MLSESMDTIVRLGSLDIDELTSMRRVLEVPAASWAARNRQAQHLSALQEVVERQRTTTIDDPDIVVYDRDFHVTIAQASGNRLLSAFISAIHETTLPARFLCVTPEVGRETVKQHIAILGAIIAGSSSGAAEAMDEHLEYVLRYSTETRDEVEA
jgi:DNA-binding FadR family transcriptional regulator